MSLNLVHPSLNRVGGAERVYVSLIETFKEEGYFVTLYTIDKVKWNLVERTFGEVRKPDKEIYLHTEIPDLRSSFLNWSFLTICFLRLMISSKRDKQSISLNNYGEVFPIMCDLCYINSVPLFSIYRNSKMNPFRLPLWPITSRIYYLFYIALKSVFKQSTIVTNSRFNSETIKEHTKKPPVIVHPPVKISNQADTEDDKENTVLTISRITRMKRLEVIPKIAREVKTPDCRFVLMGKTTDTSDAVLKDIYDLIRKYDLQQKISIIRDPDRSLVRQAVTRSSIYLSTQPSEAFGMAVVEAMASGCIPLVPKSGGPWIDILDRRQGQQGFAYTSVREAAGWIDLILSDRELERGLSLRAKERAAAFDELNFHRKFLNVVRNIQSPINEKRNLG